MRNTTEAPTIKLFVAVLYHAQVDSSTIAHILSEVFGSVEYIGGSHRFDCTTYYQDEMGEDLYRIVVGFSGPHRADILPDAKRGCIELEKAYLQDGKRTINLDVGYLDHHKIVLASTKGAGHKIYLDQGIYADFVARYSDGTYCAMPWAFPDFKDGRYSSDFLKLRALLKQSCKG
jgi:hypothetical protein